MPTQVLSDVTRPGIDLNPLDAVLSGIILSFRYSNLVISDRLDCG